MTKRQEKIGETDQFTISRLETEVRVIKELCEEGKEQREIIQSQMDILTRERDELSSKVHALIDERDELSSKEYESKDTRDEMSPEAQIKRYNDYRVTGIITEEKYERYINSLKMKSTYVKNPPIA
jgi:uncharacterized coiled-coil DUF342 family protein